MIGFLLGLWIFTHIMFAAIMGLMYSIKWLIDLDIGTGWIWLGSVIPYFISVILSKSSGN